MFSLPACQPYISGMPMGPSACIPSSRYSPIQATVTGAMCLAAAPQQGCPGCPQQQPQFTPESVLVATLLCTCNPLAPVHAEVAHRPK
mmetsp:Transcript_23501/g.42382  ORF Transcript_23501/g.42382 Transcript_23501/m.42382 type:complete len:88 (-) Transcript_23501:293-556(-)